MEQTKHYGLQKPAPEDFYDVADQNANMDAIDAALKAQEDELARKAGLDETGKVPEEQLPKLSTLELGETETTAYRGDRGKLAYEHTVDGTKHITAAEREKLAGVAEGANKTVVDAALSAASTNPVQNRAVHAALAEKANLADMTAGLLGKVDKETGKGLSSEDFTAAEKARLSGLGDGRRTCRFVVGTSTAGWTAKDCDYLCNGVDDQEEINAAIQELPEGGGEVFLLDGTYNITAPIVISKKHVSLTGAGNSSSILKRSWRSISMEGVINVSEEYVSIQNLQVHGNRELYGNGRDHGLYIVDSRNCTVYNCHIVLSQSYGIGLYNSSFGIISNNYVCDVGTNGISISGGSNNRVIGNACTKNTANVSNGVYIVSSSDNTVLANTCCVSGIGIYLAASAIDNAISGNTCLAAFDMYSKPEGIRLQHSHYNSVSGNYFGSGVYGVRIIENSLGNTITGNTCYNNKMGIVVGNCQKNIIAGNTAFRGEGVLSDYPSEEYATISLLDDKCTGNLVTSNLILGKNYVNGGGEGNTFINNKFE